MIDLIHGPGTIEKELPAMVRQFKGFDIDIDRQPMLVYPTLHYQNGGIRIRPDGSTGVDGLYVAGEAAGGIHGSNRLMGNSLLDITVFGRRAGTAAAAYALGHEPGARTLEHLRAWNRERAAGRAWPTDARRRSCCPTTRGTSARCVRSRSCRQLGIESSGDDGPDLVRSRLLTQRPSSSWAAAPRDPSA